MDDRRTLNVHKATGAEPQQQFIYDARGPNDRPGQPQIIFM